MARAARRWLAPACVLAMLLAFPAGGAAAVPELSWEDCGDGLQCATARVPLDHDRPNGRTIRLAVVRRPVTDPSRRIGSLFFNPGGPGASGVAQVRNAQPGGPLNQRFDLVGFDPRGVAGSRPAIDCFNDRQFERFLATIPAARPGNLSRFLSRGARAAAGCRRRTPAALLDQVSTADTARDMDLLRQAVGDERLTYIGSSYGTELGAVYASLFPRRVRALALDGGVDHGGRAANPLREEVEGIRAAEAALGRFFDFCSANPDNCRFANGNPRGAFDALLERLDRTPIPGTRDDPREADGTTVRTAAFAAMYDPAAWPLLGAALSDAAEGRGAGIKLIADNVAERRPDGSYSNYLEANGVISANDFRAPRSRRAYARHLRRLISASPHFAPIQMTVDAARAHLPHSDDAYTGRLRYPASSPTLLVIGSTRDNATPYHWSQALTRQLGNARLLTREGDGHTAFAFSSCIAGHTRAYLIDGTLPPEGTVCPSD